jgi:hypothetical protein
LSHGRARARETDWWAVLVELLVVVIGILIAFELTNWGERRQRAQDERELLQRIEEEARGDYAVLSQAKADHLETQRTYRRLTLALGEPGGRESFELRGGAQCTLLRLPAVQRQSAGAGALGPGERLDLISDRQLRSLLRRADAYRTFSDSQLSYFRESFQRYSAVIEPHMPWRFRTSETFECGVNLETLRSDPAAVALLPKLARDHSQIARYRTLEMEATKNVIERVSCLRSGACGD